MARAPPLQPLKARDSSLQPPSIRLGCEETRAKCFCPEVLKKGAIAVLASLLNVLFEEKNHNAFQCVGCSGALAGDERFDRTTKQPVHGKATLPDCRSQVFLLLYTLVIYAFCTTTLQKHQAVGDWSCLLLLLLLLVLQPLVLCSQCCHGASGPQHRVFVVRGPIEQRSFRFEPRRQEQKLKTYPKIATPRYSTAKFCFKFVLRNS